MAGVRQQQAVTAGHWQHPTEVPRQRMPAGTNGATNERIKETNKSEQQLAQLVRTIEGEIIPRLMLAHGPLPECESVQLDAGADCGSQGVAEFATLVLVHDASVVAERVEAMRAEGVSLETVFLDLLAPAARRLGELWEADLCDFTEVTVGLCRLQQVLREFSPAFRDEADQQGRRRRALLAPAPGEQHTFGLFMVAEFFRRAGWDVWSEPLESIEQLVETVRSEWFAVVGLSIGSENRLDALASSIRAVRRASCNRKVGVMVGGLAFIESPESVARVGADATAIDGRQAALQAETLHSLLVRREG